MPSHDESNSIPFSSKRCFLSFFLSNRVVGETNRRASRGRLRRLAPFARARASARARRGACVRVNINISTPRRIRAVRVMQNANIVPSSRHPATHARISKDAEFLSMKGKRRSKREGRGKKGRSVS